MLLKAGEIIRSKRRCYVGCTSDYLTIKARYAITISTPPKHVTTQHPHNGVCGGCYCGGARAIVHQCKLAKHIAALLQVDPEIDALAALQYLCREWSAV